MKDVLVISLGLTCGHFIFQALGANDYETALERSVFQFAALALFYWLNKEKWTRP